jgi:hypothetical protein
MGVASHVAGAGQLCDMLALRAQASHATNTFEPEEDLAAAQEKAGVAPVSINIELMESELVDTCLATHVLRAPHGLQGVPNTAS